MSGFLAGVVAALMVAGIAVTAVTRPLHMLAVIAFFLAFYWLMARLGPRRVRRNRQLYP